MADSTHRGYPRLQAPLTPAQLSNINDEFDRIYRILATLSVGRGSGATLSPSGVTPGTYGSASKTITETVNEDGILTAAADQDIAIDGSQITAGQVALARGGTGIDASGIAKGGLLVGTAAGTVGIKAAGADGLMLVADSASTGGMKWSASSVAACSLYHSASQTLTHGSESALAFDSEDYDASGLHDPVTNNTRVTIPSGYDGVFTVKGRVKFTTAFAGVLHLRIYKNGSLMTENTASGGDLSSGNEYHEVSADLNLVATDYVEIKALVELAAGSGTIATASGTGNTQFQARAAATTGGGSAVVLLEQHTASTSAHLDFTTAFSDGYDEYLIRVSNILPTTANASLVALFSTDGGTTFSSTGYKKAYAFAGSGGASGATTGEAETAAFLLGGMATTSSEGGSGHAEMNGLRVAGTKRIVIAFAFKANDGHWYHVHGASFWVNTGIVNAVRFQMDSGNIASGTIRIYGLTKG